MSHETVYEAHFLTPIDFDDRDLSIPQAPQIHSFIEIDGSYFRVESTIQNTKENRVTVLLHLIGDTLSNVTDRFSPHR